MPPRAHLRRPCREREREWRGRCVDQGLEDEWLEKLNGLRAFQPISVCEGHPVVQADPHGPSPHIKLRLREAPMPRIASHWDEHKLAVIDGVTRLLQTGDTYVNLELKLRLRASTSRLNYQEDLVARIHRRQPRVSHAIDPDTRAWLADTVHRIEQLDALVVELWRADSHRPAQ